MVEIIYDVIKELNRYSGVPGILFFLVFLRKKYSNIRIVFYLILASFLADFCNFFFIKYVLRNGYIIINSWHLTNYLLLTWFFLRVIPESKKLILLLFGIFACGATISFFFYPFTQSNSFLGTYSSIASIVMCLVTFYQILQNSNQESLANYPLFWVVTALFLFGSTTLFLNLFNNYLVFDLNVSIDLFRYIGIFNLVFNIGKNFIFLYAFILVNRGYPDYIKETISTR